MDVLVLVRLVRRVWGRRAQLPDAIENQLLVAEAGSREQTADSLDAARDQADLFLALAKNRGVRFLARIQRAGRQLPEHAINRGAKLPDEDHLAGILERNDHDRRSMPDDRDFVLGP